MSTKSLRQNQSGLVSIVVSITFILIISLITTSFALLARRETRQALDRQLSTQAFYAAESGINDAIEKGITSNDNCSDFTAVLTEGLEYTCVLVDQTPSSLQLGSVDTKDSTVVKVEAQQNIDTIRISWQGSDGDEAQFAPAGSNFALPQQDAGSSFADSTGILRAMIIPVSNGNLSRANLINNSQTLFLYPEAAASAGSTGGFEYKTENAQHGEIIDGACNVGNTDSLPQHCNVDITGLSGTTFYIHLRGIYQSSGVTIQAFSGGNTDDPVELLNGQTVIDATGKATDVLRRVQVRVPVNFEYIVPDFALESVEDICKKITVSSNNNQVTDGCLPYGPDFEGTN